MSLKVVAPSNGNYVRGQLQQIMEKEDLSKFIL